jgi:hypothetical protein
MAELAHLKLLLEVDKIGKVLFQPPRMLSFKEDLEKENNND